MRLLLRLAIGLLFAIPAFSQGARVGDGHIVLTTAKVGALNVLIPVPNANIQFCAYPNIGVPCANLVTTYTDATLGTSCPTTQQVTLSGTDVCVANADAQGNWGLWVPPGNYSFTITSPAGVFGPYYVTAGGTGGGGGSAASPPFSLQFNNAGAFGGTTGFNYFNSSIAPNGTAIISNYTDDSFSAETPAEIGLNGDDGLTFLDLLANGSDSHILISNNSRGTLGAMNSITHASGSIAIAGQAISPDAINNPLTGVQGKAFDTSSGSIGIGVSGQAFNAANGGGSSGAVLYGAEGFVNLFNLGTEAFSTIAALRARGGGTAQVSPSANNIYGLVIEDMTPLGSLAGTVSNTEQAALKIKAQTLTAAAGAKYGIKVDTGAGESQFDSALRLNVGLKDSTGSLGTSGWFLSTDGTKTLWAPVSGGGGGVSSFNTRVGAVTAANLDYTFGQSSAALNSNAGTFGFSGNTFNASAAAHTLPAVSGTIAGIPATCAVGEFYYATDATAGRTDYRCTATNTWTQVGWTNQMTTIGDTQPGGASGVPIRVGGVTSPDGLPYAYSENSTAGVPTTPIWRAPTYPERNITGTTATDTILSTDCWPKFVDYQGSVAVAVTLPTATTLGVNNCHFKLQNNTSGTATAVTVTPTTWSIIPGTTSLVIAQGQTCDIYVSQASGTRWDTECHDLPYVAGTNITITRGQFGPTLTATSTAATAFSALTSSTNTTAAMLVGTGASLTTTGSGTINANLLSSITICGTTPSIGQVLTATSTSAACWGAGGGGGGTWSTLTLSGTNTGTSMVLAPTSTTGIPFTINAPTGQTSDIFDVNLNAVRKFWIDSTGSMNFAGTNLNVGSSTSTTAAIVAAHGGNTTSLPGCLQVYNNADTLNANICASGTAGRSAMQSGIATADTVQNYVLKSPAVNPQSAGTYAVLSADFGNLITRTNASAMSDTIARAGAGTTSPAAASFGAGWFVDYCVLQTSPGSSTLTATTSTFSSTGTTAIIVAPGTCTRIISDGTNYKNSMSTAISLSRATIGVGNCASGVSSTWWNTSLVAVCRTGTNIIESILPFADADTAQIPQAIDIPADWVGAIDVKAIFSSPSTTGTVIFNVATSCAATNGTVTDDVAFNAADALSTVTLGGTANAQWASTKTGITTTGCAAGTTMQLKITRATDTASGVANLKNIEVTLRRTNLI